MYKTKAQLIHKETIVHVRSIEDNIFSTGLLHFEPEVSSSGGQYRNDL